MRAFRSETTGILAAAFLATAPLHVMQSHFGTADAAATGLAALALFFGARYLDRRTTTRFLLLSVTVGIALAVKLYVPLLVPFAILVWMLPIHLLSGHARFSLIASGHQRYELLAQAAGVVTTVGVGLALVGRWGAVGASVTMVTSAAVVWVVAQVYAQRFLGPLSFFGAARSSTRQGGLGE